MTGILNVVGVALIVAGSLIFATAGLGILRLRDVYARSTAIATAAGLGVTVILCGVLALMPSWENLLKVLVAIILQLITATVGSMAIARAGYLTGSPFDVPPEVDELAQTQETAPRE